MKILPAAFGVCLPKERGGVDTERLQVLILGRRNSLGSGFYYKVEPTDEEEVPPVILVYVLLATSDGNVLSYSTFILLPGFLRCKESN